MNQTLAACNWLDINLQLLPPLVLKARWFWLSLRLDLPEQANGMVAP